MRFDGLVRVGDHQRRASVGPTGNYEKSCADYLGKKQVCMHRRYTAGRIWSTGAGMKTSDSPVYVVLAERATHPFFCLPIFLSALSLETKKLLSCNGAATSNCF